MVITKLDILDTMAEIKVCTGYRLDGRTVREFDGLHAGALEPVYETVPGWLEPTSGCRTWRDLPARARRYVARLAELIECPVAYVSVGSERRQTVAVKPGLLRWLKSR
jgi:adenylosuccinate synthase